MFFDRSNLVIFEGHPVTISAKFLNSNECDQKIFNVSPSHNKPRPCRCSSMEPSYELWLKLAQWYSCHLKEIVDNAGLTTDIDGSQ